MSTVLVSGWDCDTRDALIKVLTGNGANTVLLNWREGGKSQRLTGDGSIVAARYEIDPLDPAAWEDAGKSMSSRFHVLDGAVHLVPGMPPGDILELSPEAWTQAMDNGIATAILGLRCSYPLLVKNPGASAVIAVVSGDSPGASVTGAGLEAMIRSVANRWATRRPSVRLNLVRMVDGESDAIASMLYLISPISSFVTGTTVVAEKRAARRLHTQSNGRSAQ